MAAPTFLIEDWASARPRLRWPLVLMVVLLLVAVLVSSDAEGVATAFLLPAATHQAPEAWTPADEIADLAAGLDELAADAATFTRTVDWVLLVCIVLLAIGVAAA